MAKRSRSPKIHKAKFKEHAPCGEPFFSTKGNLKTAWHWSKVNCERCLAVYRQEQKDKKIRKTDGKTRNG